eukprot:scaffold22298_cov84-Skeletonema_dohrnii-CCMP3373.AAC.1
MLVSFLLYLNFALLGHLTITDRHPQRYFLEVFPSSVLVGVGRSENYSAGGNNKGDVIEEQQRQGNNNYDLDEHLNDGTDGQHQSKQEEQQEEETEEQNREWRLEGQMAIGKREQQKKVPSSFYRSDKSMVDVNEWWKTMEQKIQLRQNKQKEEHHNNGDNETTMKKGKIALIMSYPN